MNGNGGAARTAVGRTAAACHPPVIRLSGTWGFVVPVRTVMCICLSIALSQAPRPATANDTDGARRSWSSFVCMHLSEITGQKSAAVDHFEQGMSSGLNFLAFARNTGITEAELEQIAPDGFRYRMGAPSDHFTIGRIFEATSNEAVDLVTARCPECRFTDKHFVEAAGQVYDEQNCSLL